MYNINVKTHKNIMKVSVHIQETSNTQQYTYSCNYSYSNKKRYRKFSLLLVLLIFLQFFSVNFPNFPNFIRHTIHDCTKHMMSRYNLQNYICLSPTIVICTNSFWWKWHPLLQTCNKYVHHFKIVHISLSNLLDLLLLELITTNFIYTIKCLSPEDFLTRIILYNVQQAISSLVLIWY